MVRPRGSAAIVSCPGPDSRRRSAPSGRCGVPSALITSTDTSGVPSPAVKPGPGVVLAFPAFSYGLPPSRGPGSVSRAVTEGESSAATSVAGAPRYAAHRASTGAATTVATTVVVSARLRSRRRRATRSFGGPTGKPLRS
ncbi:hypothetical protein Srufu_033850 [Streptomyces libani subsp. rufus]|nr:hypothetical protein Srufu_033850 [Streptomyces libani subsp. rufus]